MCSSPFTHVPKNEIQYNYSPSKFTKLVDKVHHSVDNSVNAIILHRPQRLLGKHLWKKRIMETEEHSRQVRDKVVETEVE